MRKCLTGREDKIRGSGQRREQGVVRGTMMTDRPSPCSSASCLKLNSGYFLILALQKREVPGPKVTC